ncbi:hypothetical protein JNW90_08960 [Micromonospora sp. STR1s_5]|nr:hypothetical protein [Micromonospora sp. STR1s_5]
MNSTLRRLACGALLTGTTWPTLTRLHQLRARGDLPAGRTEHPEPGPA